MDPFKYALMIQALKSDPLSMDCTAFEEGLPSLTPENIEEVFTILAAPAQHSVDTGRQIANMLHVVWHYR